MLRVARRPGERTWYATIMVGVGTDELVDQAGSREFSPPEAAQEWIEQHLPAAELPDWAADYPHHGGGVYLWGWVQEGYYSYSGHPPGGELDWEPATWTRPLLDADLVDGRVRWRKP